MKTLSRLGETGFRGEGDFLCGSAGKESTCNVGDLGSIPRLGRSPGEGNGYPLQYSGLENGLYSPWGCKESDTAEQLTLWGIPHGLVVKSPAAKQET